ncbi:hypothetical protein MKW92_040411 [Papaver armeniacum]|nr:hypothetical protein MKW92_040411 [Papaver armeniacum]
MELMFRILLHEQSLDHGDATDPKLLSSMDYHRRDVLTALETTKWQVVYDSYHSREDAISGHKRFIVAIQAHISWKKLRQGWIRFVSFSRGNTNDHIKFLDSRMPFDDTTDEIIELKSEGNEDSKMNGKENNTTNVASNYPTRTGYEVYIAIREGLGDEVVGVFFSRNKQRGSRWLDVLEVFNKYWFIYGSRMTRSFTKRRKDGELEDEFNHRPSSSYSSYVDICQDEQVNLQTPFRGHGLYSNVLTTCSRVGISNGRCKRSLHFNGICHTDHLSCSRSCVCILPTSAMFLHYSRFLCVGINALFQGGKQSHVVTNYEAHGWWICLF